VPKTEGAKHFVLLVEDNEDDERLTLRALKDTYPAPRVEVARDGEQALSYLSRWPSEGESEYQIPSLVLLDLKLPKISGQEVLKAFHRNRHLFRERDGYSECVGDGRKRLHEEANGLLRVPLGSGIGGADVVARVLPRLGARTPEF
jgi:CheY-like chemotaxis protein